MKNKVMIGIATTLLASTAGADIAVEMHKVTDKGVATAIGQITITESQHGLIFTPSLQELPPGPHGFHLHQNASCSPQVTDGKTVPAGAAGPHYDPKTSKRHDAPWGQGHLGDLPPLYVDADGKATQPVLAPRLTLQDLEGRALMIHAGGDNFSDQPKPLGGGGDRIACGVVGGKKASKE